MARRKSNQSEQSTNPTQEVEMTDTTTVEPQDVADESTTEPTEEPTEATEEEHSIDEFVDAVEASVAERDEQTGDIPVAQVEPVLLAYRGLTGGVKTKNRAKEYLTERMRVAMVPPVEDIVLARAYMLLANSLTSPAAKATRSTRTPVDPTEAYVQASVALRLASNLLRDNVPEGVSEDWAEQAKALLDESEASATELYEFETTEHEDDAEAPEATPVVQAAVKLALGKSARVAGRRAGGGGTRAAYTGERRDVAKHIAEAFADQPSGTFLKVAEIRKFHSSEYGSDLPSAGAISARLKSPKWNVEGITPEMSEDGRGLGARKA